MNSTLKKMYEIGATEEALKALIRKNTFNTALAGSAVGGTLGGAGGYATSKNDLSVDRAAVARDVLKGIAIGAIAGGVLGGGVGAARGKYHKDLLGSDNPEYIAHLRQRIADDAALRSQSPEVAAAAKAKAKAAADEAEDAIDDGVAKTLDSGGKVWPWRAGSAVMSAMKTVPVVVGTARLVRARYDEKFIEPKDKTPVQKFVSVAPQLLGLGTLAGSLAYGASGAGVKKNLGALLGAVGGIGGTKLAETRTDSLLTQMLLGKFAALRKDVQLKPHQEEAVAQLERQGSLIAAHATGAGKTLTGIAGFERLKKNGKATRAIVVVPAALRENFVENIKRFTDSSHAVYGPKGETKTKDIGDRSATDYNIVSYDLFREHGDKLIDDTGADTLIMDEVHRVRGTEGTTYNKLKELRPRFKNAVTLTGSIVNNEPNEVVPLLDITHGVGGHKLGTKKLFDSLFVNKTAKTYGFLFPKIDITKNIKNKTQLRKVLEGKVSYVSHKDLEADLPDKVIHNIEVEMSPEQSKLYNFSLSNLDPITRYKIANNIPVGQREAKDAFSQSMQARQISTDHGFLDKRLAGKNPYEYSPKVKRVVDDAIEHLAADPTHRTVIYGNLLKGQLESVEKGLNLKGVPYARFYGLGNEGLTAKTRPEQIKDFMSNKKRVLLISGAGSEGLDLKDTSMMQMLEGHYNPEKIQQAESRIRRMGSFAHKPKDQRKVIIKRYVAKPVSSGFGRLVGAIASPFGAGTGSTGIDKWIYSVADRKDGLNHDFREALVKSAEFQSADDLMGRSTSPTAQMYAQALAGTIGGPLSRSIAARGDKVLEAKMKQMLLDRGMEEYTKKKHYTKILAESKLDERAIDAQGGTAQIAGAAVTASMLAGMAGKTRSNVAESAVDILLSAASMNKRLKSLILGRPLFVRHIASAIGAGTLAGLITPSLVELAKNQVRATAMGGGKDLDIGMERYRQKLLKKMDRKYVGSKSFVSEYDTRKDLGIEMVD